VFAFITWKLIRLISVLIITNPIDMADLILN
jgi:hypothetical protein